MARKVGLQCFAHTPGPVACGTRGGAGPANMLPGSICWEPFDFNGDSLRNQNWKTDSENEQKLSSPLLSLALCGPAFLSSDGLTWSKLLETSQESTALEPWRTTKVRSQTNFDLDPRYGPAKGCWWADSTEQNLIYTYRWADSAIQCYTYIILLSVTHSCTEPLWSLSSNVCVSPTKPPSSYSTPWDLRNSSLAVS